MNDLDLLRDLGNRLDPPVPSPSERTRARIRQGIAAEGSRRAGHRAHHRATGRTPGRRRLLWLAPVGAAAAVSGLLLSGVALPGLPGVGRGAVAARPTGPASAAAREILLAAASAARSEPVRVPEPSSFVYVRERQVVYTDSNSGPGGSIVTAEVEAVTESWRSVDGRRDGGALQTGTPGATPEGLTTLPGCSEADESRTGFSSQGLPLPCSPTPGFRTDLPTEPAAALARIRTGEDGKQVTRDVLAFLNAQELLADSMPPDSRAAILEAIAGLAGVQVTPDVLTVTGVRGIAIGVASTTTREEILLDPQTYEQIGDRSVALKPSRGLPAGTVLRSTALLQRAVVDDVGRRPDGTRWTPGTK